MESIIYNTFKKRKHVIEYHKDKIPEKKVIEDCLWKAWHMTPSKQNYYPYKAHIIGPESKFDDEKLKVWHKAMHNHHNVETRALKSGEIKEEKHKVNRTYQHLSNAPYVIVITQRVVDPEKTNEWNKKCIADDGHFSEPEYESQLGNLAQATSVEVGLFVASLTGLLVEKGIDITYTQCFPKLLKKWKDLDFVNYTPLLLCSIGYGKYYKMQWMKENGLRHKELNPDGTIRNNWDRDSKASYDDIINWVEDESQTEKLSDKDKKEIKRRISLASEGTNKGIHE